jgi:hypothetical protein
MDETEGHMQYVLRYEIKSGKSNEFVEWLRQNEQTFAEHAPEGWEYAGTYLTVRSLGLSEVETRWNLEDYASLGAGWGDETELALTQQWYAYVDTTRPMTGALFKSISDVSVLPGA